jgi:hypothetical protein
MKKSSVLSVVLTILLISMISLPASAQTQNWSTQTITKDNLVSFSSLVLDSQGNPHICYVNNSDPIYYSYVTYASWNGTNWVLEPFLGSAETVALVFDATGTPTITFTGHDYKGHGMLNFFLKYISQNESQWYLKELTKSESESIPYAPKYHQMSSALDANGNLHLCFPGTYGIWNGSVWSKQSLDKSDNVYSLVLDSAGTSHILYKNDTNLKYATYANRVLTSQTFKQNAAEGSLALDKDGKPHLSYSVIGNDGVYYLNYASWIGTTWDKQAVWKEQTVYSSTNAIGYNSLALDSSGNPNISFSVGSELKLASYSGSDWNIQTVDQTSDQEGQDCYSYTSLVLDQKGKPHVSYYDWTSQTLKYAYLQAPVVTDTPTTTPTQTETPIHSNPISLMNTAIFLGSILAVILALTLLIHLRKRKTKKEI